MILLMLGAVQQLFSLTCEVEMLIFNIIFTSAFMNNMTIKI